jgi:hypothetical protein
MTTSNATRASRAENALQAYVEDKGEVFENSRSEIADLIADLLHLIDRDHNPTDAPAPWVDDLVRSTLDLAQMHFDAERADPEEANQQQDIDPSLPPLGKLIYMPEETTPTVAVLSSKQAVAYIEPGQHADHYGRLFTNAPAMLDVLLDIKRLAESGDDSGYEPFALLNLIAEKARAAVAL